MRQLTVIVERLTGLHEVDDVYIILRVGDKRAVTPYGLRSGPVIEFNATTYFLEEDKLDEDLEIIVMDREATVVAQAKISQWESRLVQNKVLAHAELADQSGARCGSLDLKLICDTDRVEPTFDRLECYVAKATLPDSVEDPQFFVQYGNLNRELKKGTLEGDSTWLLDESFTFLYEGERMLTILCRDCHDVLVCKAKYDTHEIERNNKKKRNAQCSRDVGLLSLCNDDGDRVGSILIGLELWSSDSKENTKFATLTDRVEYHDAVLKSLTASPDTVKVEQFVGESRNALQEVRLISAQLNDEIKSKTEWKRERKLIQTKLQEVEDLLVKAEKILYAAAYDQVLQDYSVIKHIRQSLKPEVRRMKMFMETSPKSNVDMDEGLDQLLESEAKCEECLVTCAHHRGCLTEAEHFNQILTHLKACQTQRLAAERLAASLGQLVDQFEAASVRGAQSIRANFPTFSETKPIVVERATLPFLRCCMM